MSNPIFINQVINNGALSAIKAMPLKDKTSDNTSSFELSRKIYENTYTTALTNDQVLSAIKPSYYGMNGVRPTVFDGTTAPIQKKWMGSTNRDASQITANRRTNSVGKGSLNYNTTDYTPTLSFTNGNDRNLLNRTLRRVRGGGYVAPPKKAASPSQTYVPSHGTHPYMQPGFKGKIGGYFPNSRYNNSNM